MPTLGRRLYAACGHERIGNQPVRLRFRLVLKI